MQVAVTGASGFLGTHILKRLSGNGHSLRVLGRRAVEGYPSWRWDADCAVPPARSLEGVDAVVHLAGEPIAQRWTREAKARIVSSRIDGTEHLVEALSLEPVRPSVLISASAVDYYGARGDETLTESSSAGSGFLAETCVAWEACARRAESLGIRVVRLRFGIVLGTEGGALPKMLPPFRAGLGGPLGGGRQWMSWIHVRDAARLVAFAIAHEEVRGGVNAVTPSPVTNREFTNRLGRALHRPAFLPVPAVALRLLFGEMAEVVLGSHRVLPHAAQQAGFEFELPALENALQDLL